ncbi:uncharacterized protein B0P05DRAFT_598928 [Gilbertella persicaria]|uniref:uncharacterized protein n=1 Tax=Gilbertella persicaria TaxID=101096 RepID=UPI0022205AA2|nr:uncharacterized protein B0P05DRAFT_598928 [Gilbertella persicaria]KAI8066280.1 hypothetical protein B0P05DRAFT_598928 [Gilbertella persicaria]
MTIHRQSTVIFVHSTAHWESILQQRAQLLGISRETAPEKQQKPKVYKDKRPESSDEQKKESRYSHLIGKEGSRRRQRWTNNTFSDHPSAVLYAEDLRPPGYHTNQPRKHHQTITALSLDQEDQELTLNLIEKNATPQLLSRHVRHDLKKAHISQSLVTNYELQLIQFIDQWLNDLYALEHAYLKLQVASNNQFERYVLHTMSRYYGLYSFSQDDDEQHGRMTYICHPAYTNYVTKSDKDSIDYVNAANWSMPEKSFYDYLFNRK